MVTWCRIQGVEYTAGEVKVTLSGHSVVITGYDQHYIYVNDPYGYKNRKIEKQTFIDAWKEMGRQAISIGLSDSIMSYPIVSLAIR
ncbi:C39 family peptidase [Bacillus sp. MRMR6]|uniref:C39 family peptidase n=1 Tax=Bacillus sp. MRMR6 TaxID=1928617 RepID=UPI0009F9E516|nr:C39 family peptidase [Bacillus sp. MRMR6]